MELILRRAAHRDCYSQKSKHRIGCVRAGKHADTGQGRKEPFITVHLGVEGWDWVWKVRWEKDRNGFLHTPHMKGFSMDLFVKDEWKMNAHLYSKKKLKRRLEWWWHFSFILGEGSYRSCSGITVGDSDFEPSVFVFFWRGTPTAAWAWFGRALLFPSGCVPLERGGTAFETPDDTRSWDDICITRVILPC